MGRRPHLWQYAVVVAIVVVARVAIGDAWTRHHEVIFVIGLVLLLALAAANRYYGWRAANRKRT
jgi:hypothetical protein